MSTNTVSQLKSTPESTRQVELVLTHQALRRVRAGERRGRHGICHPVLTSLLLLLKQMTTNPGGLKRQKCILSPFWSPEVSDQGVDGATFRPKTLGENAFPPRRASLACGCVTPLSASILTSLLFLSCGGCLSLDLGPPG